MLTMFTIDFYIGIFFFFLLLGMSCVEIANNEVADDPEQGPEMLLFEDLVNDKFIDDVAAIV